MSMSAGAAGAGAGSRAAHPRMRPRFTPGAAILALVVVALLFALAVPVRTLLQQRSDLAKLQRQEQVLQQQNTALNQRLLQLHDPVYLEKVARECLGMVRPGEIAFVVVPKAGASPAPTSGSTSGSASGSTQGAPDC